MNLNQKAHYWKGLNAKLMRVQQLPVKLDVKEICNNENRPPFLF